LSGTTAADHHLLMEKSNGVFELAVWNESDAAHNVTLTLPQPAQALRIYVPLTGVSYVQAVANSTSITFTVPDHPVIVEIVPGGASTLSVPTPPGPGMAATAIARDTEAAHAITAGSGDAISMIDGTNLLYATGSGNVINGGSGADRIQAFGGGN